MMSRGRHRLERLADLQGAVVLQDAVQQRAHQRRPRAGPPQPGRPLFDQLVDDVLRAALSRSMSVTAFVTRAVRADPPGQTLGVACNSLPTISPVSRESPGRAASRSSCAPDPPLSPLVEHPPGAEARGHPGAAVCGSPGRAAPASRPTAGTPRRRRVEARRVAAGETADSARNRLGFFQSKSEWRDSRSTVSTAASGGVSDPCTPNHLSTTSRSWAQSAWNAASAAPPAHARPAARARAIRSVMLSAASNCARAPRLRIERGQQAPAPAPGAPAGRRPRRRGCRPGHGVPA